MSWIRGLSIRTRITLGTLMVAIVVSVVASLLLQANVRSIVHATTDQLLEGDSAPFEAAIRRDPSSPQVTAGERQLVALVMPNGRTSLSNLPDRLESRLPKLLTIGEKPREVSIGATTYLVRREAVQTTSGKWQIVVARSLEPANLVMNQLGVTLIIGALVLFLIFGVASWALSGIALRPVSRMRVEAERLAKNGSFGLLPVGPARDELADLASTLNSLIERNRQTLERERQLLSDASHELRTPLAVLIAQLDEATSPLAGTAEQGSLVAGARTTALRLSHLAINLLELSRLEAGPGSTTSTWSELARELSTSIDTARVLAEPQGIGVDFEISDAPANATFKLSGVSFGRVVDNLLSNAVAASPSTETVHVDLSADADGLILTVRDHGPGMPEDFIPIAFDRFTRPDIARERTTGGGGLGLAIVAAIVSAANGEIALNNTPPGLTVAVSIPYQRMRSTSSD